MDDMNEVFTKCQIFEKDRLNNFRDFIGKTQKCLDLSSRPQLPQIFQQFSQTIKNVDPDKDLSMWSETYGAGMKMNWPIFEEYTEAHRTLSRRAKGDMEKDPVIMTAIRPNNNNNNAQISGNNQLTTTSQLSDNGSYRASINPAYSTINGGGSSLPLTTTSITTQHHSLQHNPSYPSANPFYDEEDDTDSIPLQTPPDSSTDIHGVPVRALYDYEAQEPDELSFKQGETFMKLEDEDDQGWCKGRVGNRVGLYPATYVETV